MTGRVIAGLALLAAFLGARLARADEIRLKDGSKIIGTIVGFENDSFRVETNYGFALIQKDKVADISITPSKKDPEPKAKSTAPPSAPTPAAAPTVVPAIAKESKPANVLPETNATSPQHPAVSVSAPTAIGEPTPPKPKVVAAAPPPQPQPQPPPTSLPPPPSPPPAPPAIRDEIRGNTYANLTYGFQMYKPPSWDLIPAARKALPDALAALGTYDQTTLLVIGREHATDSLDAHAAATGKALGGVYENYRVISNKHVSIGGLPGVEQRSRGTVDGRDWSVILVTLLKGNDAFTLLGMTWADSDLIQVQENIITKTVNSLTFQTN